MILVHHPNSSTVQVLKQRCIEASFITMLRRRGPTDQGTTNSHLGSLFMYFEILHNQVLSSSTNLMKRPGRLVFSQTISLLPETPRDSRKQSYTKARALLEHDFHIIHKIHKRPVPFLVQNVEARI